MSLQTIKSINAIRFSVWSPSEIRKYFGGIPGGLRSVYKDMNQAYAPFTELVKKSGHDMRFISDAS